MKILSIETSCDETAISLLEVKGGIKNPKFKILGNALRSQIKIHEQYGGVFPMMAKREHQKNLTPILLKVLKESGFLEYRIKIQDSSTALQVTFQPFNFFTKCLRRLLHRRHLLQGRGGQPRCRPLF